MLNPDNLVKKVMAHRFLYYILNAPIISDYEYDQLEKEARRLAPKTSPVHSVGSDIEASYPAHVKVHALSLLEKHNHTKRRKL